MKSKFHNILNGKTRKLMNVAEFTCISIESVPDHLNNFIIIHFVKDTIT